MIINHNLMANNAIRSMNGNSAKASSSMEKLSSGLRINRAGDDAAGLAISEKMRGQIRGLDQASTNAQDGISLIQTAEGALNETHSILQRMRELGVQSANDTNTGIDRGEIQKEMDQLNSEIDRISNTTEFNTKKLIDGSLNGATEILGSVTFDNAGDKAIFQSVVATTPATTALPDGSEENETLTLKIGAFSAGNYAVTVTSQTGATTTLSVSAGGGTLTVPTLSTTTTGTVTGSYDVNIGVISTADIGKESTFTSRASVRNLTDNSLSFHIGANSAQVMNVNIEDMSSAGLKLKGLNVKTAAAAESSISAINKAIEDVSSQRSKLGAFQNRLEHTINNLGTASENLTSAESRIRDVDMAKEMSTFSKNNILSQAAQAMLAQANQQPQQVLQLLR